MEEVLEPVTTMHPSEHLGAKSIFLKNDISEAPSMSAFKLACSSYAKSSYCDHQKLYLSCLAFFSKYKGGAISEDLWTRSIAPVATIFVDTIDKEITSAHAEKRRPLFNGEALDVLVSFTPAHCITHLSPVLDGLIRFIDAGGKFEPATLPSTWRRLWTSVAWRVTKDGFHQQLYPKICAQMVAMFYYIYLKQTEVTGHLRSGKLVGADSITIPSSFLSASAARVAAPSQSRPLSVMDIDLEEIKLSDKESPLLRSPHTVSSLLAILSGLGGHGALRKALIDLFVTYLSADKTFPPRRLIPIASLLYSWGQKEAAEKTLATLHSVITYNPDPNTHRPELTALEFLMVTNNPQALLEFALSLVMLQGHTSSPHALSYIIWAIKETKQYDALMKWWRPAIVAWRKVSLLPNTHTRGTDRARHVKTELVRIPKEATLSMLEIAEKHLNYESLKEIMSDIVEVFAFRPSGYRSRLIGALASEGRFSEAIAALGDHFETTSSPGQSSTPVTFNLDGSEPINTADLLKAAENLNESPRRPSLPSSLETAEPPYIMTSKILLALLEKGVFDEHMDNLIKTAVSTSGSTFRTGVLVDHVATTIADPTKPLEAFKYIPFLNWIASLPLPAGVPPRKYPGNAQGVHQVLKESREKYGTSVEDQVRFTARTAVRMADIAGTAGLPEVVNNIIQRINAQYEQETKTTMPLNAVWIKPLLKAHGYLGHLDVQLQLLASLKKELLPTDRAVMWKLAFKFLLLGDHLDKALQLFLSLKKIDEQVPSWSGGYTMGMIALLEKDEYESALQLYELMTSDGFDLRDHSIVTRCMTYLNNLQQTDPTAFSDNHARVLKRLTFLQPTLEPNSVPNFRADPAAARRKRVNKQIEKRSKQFVTTLDRSMSSYESTHHSKRNPPL